MQMQSKNTTYKKILFVNTRSKISDIHKHLSLKIDSKKRIVLFMEVTNMSSQSRSNRVEVPEAKAAMDKFKTEVASELGVNLKEGYNGDLTSREAGSIGGEMVRRMVKSYEESIK